jgi:hypothetical protein
MIPLMAFADEVAVPDIGQKSKLQFVRSSGKMDILQARIEVNGKLIGKIGKGETNDVTIEPGRTMVKIDSVFSPGQLSFSFASEKGAEYHFEIFNGIDPMDVAHLFGSPSKVINGELLESGGVLKATLTNVVLPKTIDPIPVVNPVKVESDPVPVKPIAEPVAKPSVEEQLRTLKHLYEQELISKDTYNERQKKILDGL